MSDAEVFYSEVDDSELEEDEVEDGDEEEESDADHSDLSREQFLHHLKQKRAENFDLPSTVVMLQAPRGGKVYVIGTSHFSEESIKDVEFMIDKTWPDYVVIELCKNRSQMLHMDEDEIKKQVANYNLKSFVKLYGLSGGLVHYLMLRMSAYIMKTIGSAPGGEFRVAYKKAQALPHSRVFLGDRPVSLTFQRALASLGPWTRMKLVFGLMKGLEPITKEQMEAMKNSDLLEQLMQELAGDYPEISRVFVTERDQYLARSIWDVSRPRCPLAAGGGVSCGSSGDHSQCAPPEGAVEEIPPVTVAVVGLGHLAGIVQHWDNAQSINKDQLCSIPPPTVSSRILSYSIRLTLIGLALSGGFLVTRKLVRSVASLVQY